MDDFVKTLVSAVVGGFIVLCTQLLLERRKHECEKQKETKRRKAEKLEELSSALYAHEYWLIQLQAAIPAGETNLQALIAKLPPPPMATLHLISNIYFYEFQGHTQDFSKIADWINSIVRDAQPNAVPSNEFYLRTLVEHSKVVKRLEDLIRDYAKREFQ
jgi:hypothetical protein